MVYVRVLNGIHDESTAIERDNIKIISNQYIYISSYAAAKAVLPLPEGREIMLLIGHVPTYHKYIGQQCIIFVVVGSTFGTICINSVRFLSR